MVQVELFTSQWNAYLQDEIATWNKECVDSNSESGIRMNCYLYLSTYYESIDVKSKFMDNDPSVLGTIDVQAYFDVGNANFVIVPDSITTMFNVIMPYEDDEWPYEDDEDNCTICTFNSVFVFPIDASNNFKQTSSKMMQIDITPEMCMFQGHYYDECITTVGTRRGTYQSCRCDNADMTEDLYDKYCYHTEYYPCYFFDSHNNTVNPSTTRLNTVTIALNWEQIMTSLRINGGDTQIGVKVFLDGFFFPYSSSRTNVFNLVTYNKKYPAMPPLYGNLTQFSLGPMPTYDTYYTMTTANYRPMVVEKLYDSLFDDNIILSLDYFPLNNPQYQNYYCPFNAKQNSECSPLSEIYYGFSDIANFTGAGLQVQLVNNGLIFQGGFIYEGPIPTFDLQHYNPVVSQARLYFCSYGTYNLLAKTMSTTYATINPILSVVLAIIIMVALFQIRYIYGQDIQQLYYQEIENNKQYQQNRTSNDDPYDVLASQRKVDGVTGFLAGGSDDFDD